MGLHQNKTQLISIYLIILIVSITSEAFSNKTLVFTKYASAPYINYISNAEPEGFICDIFENLNGGTFEFEFTKDTIDLITSEFIYAGITKNEVPKGYYFLELPHRLKYFVFTRKGANILSLNDLLNKKIIVVKNDLPYQLLYENKASYILKVKSYNEALAMLSSGFNDCAIIPFQIGLQIIKSEDFKNIEYVITPFLSFEYGIAIPEGSTSIIKQFEIALQQSLKNNVYQLVEDEWIVSDSEKKAELSDIEIMMIVALIILGIIVLLLFGFIRFLIQEINSSTLDYISEISEANISPLTINLNNPLIIKLLTSAPIWMFVNDINGNVHHISQDLVLELLHVEQTPDNLKVTDLFNKELSDLLASYDNKLVNKGSTLIAEQIQFNIDDNKFNKWLVKYPLRVQGNTQLLILNLFVKPIIESDYSFRSVSPEFVFHSVIDALPDLIYIKNEKGIYLGCNKAFLEFSGKSEVEIIGKTDLEVFGEDKALIYSKSDNLVFSGGTIWEDEVWDVTSKIDNVRLEKVKIPLINKKNEIFALLGISHDVTAHHKYEQELALAKERAEESDRIKSSFLANMSHEIRTPMNAIIGFSDLLADSDLTIDQRIEIIDMIQTNGHNLIDLIDDIIDFSRIEAGQIHLKFNDFNLNAVVKDAYNYAISKRNQLNKEHMNITYALGAVNDTFMIHSDPFRLRQVLKNLMNSSIRFSTSESIFLGYLIRGNELILYIKNDISTISDEIIEKLIARQTNFKFSVSDLEESAGIALIIAKNVIEMIGGKLYVEEIIPGRSDFYFAIPLKLAEPVEPIKSTSTFTDIPDWSNKTILIAEDEEVNFILLDSLISKTKAKIIRAVNGKLAVELFQENVSQINLTLMDIRMPEMNGADAARKILELYPNTPIIGQTAYAMPEDKDQYLKVGMKAVLAKPIDPSELYYVCNKYLVKK